MSIKALDKESMSKKYPIGGEVAAVQNPMIGYVQEEEATYGDPSGKVTRFTLGWEYLKPDECLRLREGKGNLILRDIFIKQVQRLNPGIVDNLMAEELIGKLERIPPTKTGNKEAWEYIKGDKTVFVAYENRERNLNLLDTDDIDKNVFHVTQELIFDNGRKNNRIDVAFYVNGIPLLLVENKAAHKPEGIAEALDQVRRYHVQSPELLAMMQVYALTHLIKFYYSATWNHTHKYLYNWKEESVGTDFEGLVKTFFDRKRIIQILTDFILFTIQDDSLAKIILRPHQMRAVNKLVERAADKEKKRALVWHTQGSGKTFTMITTAEKLTENPQFENPTVILLVDRNELESQLFNNLESVGKENFQQADSKKHLTELLKDDYRGVIVSTIHKFEGMAEKINTRENIFVLIDEAHRTTGGRLGNFLMGAIPNATLIGFTGTPIDKSTHGQGTFVTFGRDDAGNGGYMDKYSIGESIEDKTTLKLHYSLADNDLLVDKETLEKEFLNLSETEGISDVEQLNTVLEKAVTLRNMLKNRDRIAKIAKYAADHFTSNVEPLGYKAFLVAVDREACTFYKEELDKHLPAEYSEVVYSGAHNDPEHLAEYHLEDEAEKRIRKAFRDPQKQPNILIVTEKLLTGFDAPVLYCMYLDKPMRDHVLLQTIARVNRPYEDKETGREKPCGLVIDFVGIFGNLKKALAFDSADIEGIVDDIELLKEEFATQMEHARKGYLKIAKGKGQDKAVEAILDYFRDEEEREDFYSFFRNVRDMYDIISPDAFMRPYEHDYESLCRIYRITREAYNPSITIDREFSRKTAKLVQDHSQGGDIKGGLDVYEVNEKTLKRIEESQASDTEKIFNLIKGIEKAIREEAHQNPILIPIGERAQAIVERFKGRLQNSSETLEDIKKLIEEYNAARKAQEEKNMSLDIFMVYWELKRRDLPEAELLANELREVFDQHPHWHKSERQERAIRQALYKQLLTKKALPAKEVTGVVKDLIQNLKLSKRD